MITRPPDLRGWAKWRSDFSTTRTQVGYFGLLIVGLLFLRGLMLVTDMSDFVSFAGAMLPLVLTLIGAWGLDKNADRSAQVTIERTRIETRKGIDAQPGRYSE